MADVRKVVEIVLNVIGTDTKKINNLVGAFDKLSASVKKTTDRLKSDLTSASKPVQKLAKDVKVLGEKSEESGLKVRTFGDKVRTVFEFRLISMLLIEIKDSIIAAAGAIIEYSQALKDLQAITGATTASISQMGDKIIEVASKTKFSATEVAEGMRVIGQAGFTAGEAVESMQSISDLATGTLSTMAASVDLVTTALRIFNIDATESAMVADVFANAVNRSKLTIDKLRTSMNYIGPIAKAAGISFKELSASMMVLANSGLRASKIGTGLRRVFAELVDPSKKLKNAARDAGIALSELDPSSTSLSTVIANLGLVVNDAQIAFDIFGKRGAAAVLALSGSTGNFNEMLQVVQKSGTAAEMAAIQMEGLGVSFKNLKDKLGVLAITIGKAGIADAMRLFVDATRLLVDVLTFFIDNTAARFLGKAALMTTAILGIVGALKLLGSATALNAVGFAFARFTTAVLGASAAVTGFGTAATISFPPLLAISAIIGTVAGAMYLFSDSAGEASSEALKLSSEYKNLDTYMTAYTEKTAAMVEGSEELKVANIELRKKLHDVADTYGELANEAFYAIQSIDPLTGFINDNSEAIGILKTKIAEAKYDKLVESIQKSSESFKKQTGFFHRLTTSIGDTVKTAKLAFTDTKALNKFQELRKEANRMAKDLHSGVKGFADLHEYINSIDLKNLSAQQDVLLKKYKDFMEAGGIAYEHLKNTGEISLDYPIKQIGDIAEAAGITGETLEAMLIHVGRLQELSGINPGSLVEKWSKAIEDGGLEALGNYIELHKELGIEISDTQAAQIREIDFRKKDLADRFKTLEEWRKGEEAQKNNSQEMWTKYWADLAVLKKEARATEKELAANDAAQTMKSILAENKRYADEVAAINKMDDDLMKAKTKRLQDELTKHTAIMNKLRKNFTDPAEILAASKEEEIILKNSYKTKQSLLEISLRKRGASNATVTKEIQKLESELTQKVVELWDAANKEIQAQNAPDSAPVRAIKKKQLAAELAHVKSISAIKLEAMEQEIADQNTLYETANTNRKVEHTKHIEEMISKEMELGTSTEEIEKKKSKMTLDYFNDRMVAAEFHFEEAKMLYAEDSEEYLDRQQELATATIKFYEERLKHTKKYAELEYKVEKAKIQAIIALNKAIYESDSKVQQAQIDSARKILKASYDNRLKTHREYYAKERELAKKDFNEKVENLVELREVQAQNLSELEKLEKGDVGREKAKLELKTKILDLTTQIQVLQEKQPGLLAAINAEENKAIETSNKKIAGMVRQFEALKNTSDISLNADDSRDLAKKHDAEMKQLTDANTYKIGLLREEVRLNIAAVEELNAAKKIASDLVNNLEKKQARERHEQALEYQELELEGLITKSEVQHSLRVKAIEEELAAGNISTQEAEKRKLDANVAYYNKVRIEAAKHYKLLSKFDTVEEHKARLQSKLEADKEYYDALTDRIIGLSDIQKEVEEAKFDADESKTESQFELDMTKQTEATKTALVETKAQFDQDLINSKEYFDKKREIAAKDLDVQLNMLAAKKVIFKAQMEMRIAEEEDEAKKITLRAEMNKALGSVTEAEVKAKENYNRTIAKIDADDFKNTEKNQKKVESMIDAAKKARNSLLQDDKTTSLATKQQSELQIFDETTRGLVDAMIEREATLAQQEEFANERKATRDLLVAQQEEEMHDLRLQQMQNFTSSMASLTASLYNSGLIQGKKAFGLMQSFAIAEAMINTYKSATDAYASAGNPYLGAVMAAIAIAQGLANVAIIRQQKPAGYAAGGQIQGYSPNPTSDNIDIKATAGEYMQPVKAVQKYGLRVMNAIRNLSIPKESLQNLLTGGMGLSIPIPSYALAAGGPVSASVASTGSSGSMNKILSDLNKSIKQKQPINILNVRDPREISNELASPEGTGGILNVISSNAMRIRRIIG